MRIDRPSRAVRYMVLSALGFALMSTCVKSAAQGGIPVLEIIAARSFISLILSYWDVKRKGLSVWGHNYGLLVARAVVGTVALFCVYYSVATLPLADATVLQYTYPMFTAVLALLFLGESIKRATLYSIVLSFVGVIVMTRPGTGGVGLGLPTLSLFTAMVGSFGSAVAYVLVRKLSQHEDSSVIIFYFPLVALPLSLIGLGQDFVVPSIQDMGILLLVGIFTQIGQIGLTKAMASEAAGSVASYSYAQILFSAVLGMIFFSESLTFWTVMGGLLIVSGPLLNAFKPR